MTVDSVKLLSGEAQMGTASPWCTEARTRGCSCRRWVRGHVSRVTCHVSRVTCITCPVSRWWGAGQQRGRGSGGGTGWSGSTARCRAASRRPSACSRSPRLADVVIRCLLHNNAMLYHVQALIEVIVTREESPLPPPEQSQDEHRGVNMAETRDTDEDEEIARHKKAIASKEHIHLTSK